ncbi:MAG: leucine-rich repeat protein [Clostridia bacterium]|nr:leucine-rich repeat protein [Clostridia bacterium]
MKSFRKILLLLALVFTLAMTCVVMSNAATYHTDVVDGVSYWYMKHDGTKATILGVTAETAVGDVVIPEKLGGNQVVSIDEYAFSNCTELTSITAPSGLKYIYKNAFRNCTALKSVILPMVKEIDKYAFSNCSALTTLSVPANVSYDSGTFDGCTNITDITITKGTSGGMVSYKTDSDYRSYYRNTPWYAGRNNDLKITVEEGVGNIGSYAFYNCTGLKEISLPKSISSYGTDAFSGCNNLESITIPAEFIVNDDAFSQLTKIKNVTVTKGTTGVIPAGDGNLLWHKLPDGGYDIIFEEGITDIGVEAFENAVGIKSITFPASIEKIGADAFYNSQIENVYISDLDKWLNINFSGNGNPVRGNTKLWLNGELLTKIVVPDGVEKIGDNIFSLWKGLTDITISDSVTSIGSYAFNGCTGLKEIVIPDSVTTIGDCAFQGCKSLEKADLPDSVTTMGSSVFKDCKSLKEADIPKSLTAIEYQTYLYCESLTSVVIPYGVKTIEKRAFQNCYNLESVTIPDSVTTIENEAFGYCKKISGLTLSNNVKYLGTSILYGNNVIHYVGISSDIEGYKDYSRYNNIHYIPDPARVRSCSDGPFSSADDCEICAEWISKNNRKDLHSFSEYKSNGDATCLSDGTKTARCNNKLYCDMEDTIQDVGSKKGHSDSDKDGVCNECRTDFTVGCGHLCHKGGIEGFFYKIARFFWKLFKTNEVCSCGMYHY